MNESDLEAVAPRNIAPLATTFEVGLAVVAILAGRWFGPMPLDSVDLAWSGWQANALAIVWGIVAALPLVAGLFLVQRTAIPPLRKLNELVDRQIVPLFAETSLLELGLVSLAAGVGEEMLFRGWLQPFVAQIWSGSGSWGVCLGLVAASCVFGAAHWVSLAYALLACMIGFYLGLLFLWTGNLLAPAVTHGLYDFVALVYLVRCRQETKSGGST